MLAFIRNLVGVKTDQAVQAGLEALVRWDPQSATEAELRTMEQYLDDLGMQVAQTRAAYEREKKEADAINALSQQRLAAAEQMQRQIESATDPARKASLEKSLETVVGLLEEMAPEIERERREAEDAREFLDMLENAYKESGAKLKAARSQLQKAQRDMARAAQQRGMADRRAEAARQAAGLSGATSSLNVALKAMQDAAARDLASAEAANAKAKLLKPTKPEEDDPNIVAAMQAVSGTPPKPTDLAGRLAAIRARH
jgi:chromosome segregation ATPase